MTMKKAYLVRIFLVPSLLSPLYVKHIKHQARAENINNSKSVVFPREGPDMHACDHRCQFGSPH